MRITCVIGTLGGGGAERVMTYLCGGLADRGHQVTLLTLDNSVPDFYTLPANVTRVRCNLPAFKQAGILGAIPRFWKMTRALQKTKPEVVISFMTVTVLASCRLLRYPVIYADHLDVRHTPFSRKWTILRNWLLRYASKVVVLSKRDRKFIAMFHRKWRPCVIYNPALPADPTPRPRPDFMLPDKKYVIAVGRLVRQKGFDFLLEAWRRVCEEFPDWRLAIIGEGKRLAELKNYAEITDVGHCVDFVPPIKGLQAVYQHADLFAMSSRAEGFPMVLLEAMAAGLPAVSFSCTGPDVIIRDGVDGFLVKQRQTELLAERLADLMRDGVLRGVFAARAQDVTSRFSLEDYLNAYEDLCKKAVRK